MNPRKDYPADPALIPVYDRSGKPNVGQALETAVFIQLLRTRADIVHVKTPRGFEVDFLARTDGEKLIQVCANIDDPETLAREIRALEDAAPVYPRAEKVLLTMESRLPFPEVPSSIRMLPAWQWMLETILD